MEKYSPQDIEKQIYQKWEQHQCFNPDTAVKTQKNFSIVIPPPNVTGYLHIGHALVNSLQDLIVRRKRMQGYRTLWLPGTDHAGIATQMVVEKYLRTQGIERKALGKQKFIEAVWKWKKKHGNQISKQLQRLGASLDWSRERFTLDEGLSEAVRQSFVQLYNQGFIYRAEYLVNWCPKDQTALSDLEVEHQEVTGAITQIRYPLADGSGFIEIATTRAETLLGDTAIAVHPTDKRYKNLIGKKAIVPLVARQIPIIADEMCDLSFGTGALKITPAHDHNDFLIGKKHSLEFINIFTADAKLNEIYPPLQGLDRFTAREKVIELLKEQNLWVSTKKHCHKIGYSQRSRVVVEPRLSTQWFCKMKEMAAAAIKQVEKENIAFYPVAQKKVFYEWLTNIQDWCISRQLWWGHSIPAWHCEQCEAIQVAQKKPIDCQKCHCLKLQADPDVLDTWYSSALFPFSTMGWPSTKTKDFQNFYPTSLLITGYDILFFWVARMIMLGLKLTKQLPFPEVVLHGLVRDAKGDKMSKTKGNVIDPLNIIDKHGADALRFTLCSLVVDCNDLKLLEKDILQSKFFLNKLWNASAFVLYHLEQNNIKQELARPEKLDIFTIWIIKELQNTICIVNKQLDKYCFFAYADALYNFIWGKFCDWYLEISKPMLFGKLTKAEQISALYGLNLVLQTILKLLHPICPFVTEKLWGKLPTTSGLLITKEYPSHKPELLNQDSSSATHIISIIEQIRTIKGASNLQPREPVALFITPQTPKLAQAITHHKLIFQALAGVSSISFTAQIKKKAGFALSQTGKIQFMLDLSQKLDVAGDQKRLQTQLQKHQKRQEQLALKLANPQFISNAPASLVQANKQEVKELAELKEQLALQLQKLG